MKNLRKMFPYIRDEYGRLVGIAIASLAIAGVSALQPQLFKNVLDNLIQNLNTGETAGDLPRQFAYLAGLSAIYLVGSHLFNVYSDQVMFRIRVSLRIRIFKRITALSLDYFETHQAGAIGQKAGESIMRFSEWVRMLAYSFLGPIFTLVLITAILFRQNIILGSLALMVIIVSYVEYLRTRKKTRPLTKKWNYYGERSGGIFTETISNMSTIATSAHVDQFRDDYNENQTTMLGYIMQTKQMWNNSSFRRSIFNEFAYLAALATSVWLAINGQATAGDLLAMTVYFGMIRSNATSFAQFIPLTDEADVSAERLLELLEMKPTIVDASHAVPLKRLESIEFKDVSFAYPESTKGAITAISFRIDAKKNIALVGPSGVGKSTITKLMLRFYNPTSGEIYINDEPVSVYTIESVREHIGMVMQDVALFNTSVKDNLRLARPKARMADIELAAEQAHAAEFIDELPKQYNTLVGERGVKLSGGQKQRVAIARAILKNPDLIILDEATSALDSESEKLVQDGLQKLQKGRMSLTIAHRLSTVQHADEILVLKAGAISERGTHSQLIAKPNGLYRKLFTLQSATGEIKL